MGNIFEKSKNTARNAANSIEFQNMGNLKHNQVLKIIMKPTFFVTFRVITSRLTGLFESMCEICKVYGILFHFYRLCVKTNQSIGSKVRAEMCYGNLKGNTQCTFFVKKIYRINCISILSSANFIQTTMDIW